MAFAHTGLTNQHRICLLAREMHLDQAGGFRVGPITGSKQPAGRRRLRSRRTAQGAVRRPGSVTCQPPHETLPLSPSLGAAGRRTPEGCARGRPSIEVEGNCRMGASIGLSIQVVTVR